MTSTITLLNPLPKALAHYEAAVVSCLQGTGQKILVAPSTDISVSDTGASRSLTAARALGERLLSIRRTNDRVLVLWPAFGYLDRILWTAGSRVSIVFHDPSQLRRQFGLSQTSSRLGSWLSASSSPRILVHSEQARRDVLARGLKVDDVLPLPMLTPRETGHTQRIVSVLGQYKSARNLVLLEELGPILRQRGFQPTIRGRRWPKVAGWDVVDEFMSEEAFTQQVASSAVVILPYTKLFQSDVAVRSAELCTPVVGPRASNLRDLFGPDWLGLMSPGASAYAWADAVERAAELQTGETRDLARRAYHGARAAWQNWAAEYEPRSVKSH